jgi:hypothetical protein
MINIKQLMPIILLFLVTTGVFLLSASWLDTKGVGRTVLIGGNLFVFLITLISSLILQKGMDKDRTMAFIRSVYTSFIVKFLLVVVVVFLYAYKAGANLDRAAVLICMFLYLVYTFIEVRVLLKAMKSQQDAEKRSAA